MFFLTWFWGINEKRLAIFYKSLFSGVEYGVRTHDLRNHNPTL